MKKLFFYVTVFALIIVACQQNSDDLSPTQESISVDMSDFYVFTNDDELSAKSNDKTVFDRCHTMQVLNRQLQENPGLYQKMYAIEKQTREFINAKKPTNPGGGGGKPDNGGDVDVDVLPIDDGLGTIRIPVNIQVVYANPLQNISEEQIDSQIAVLNADFKAANSDLILPGETTFENDVAEEINIEFYRYQTEWHSDGTSSWGTSNAVKSEYPPINPGTSLNIWVCNIGSSILGYAQFPGGSTATDGIVISPQYFGDTGYVSSPYDKGRTATHEVGHWLNLRHIWGDGRCRQDDFVQDTPSSDRPNYGCPGFPTKHCKSADMTMNYMDYTYDECMYMFTDGQSNRMRALFATNGARANYNH